MRGNNVNVEEGKRKEDKQEFKQWRKMKDRRKYRTDEDEGEKMKKTKKMENRLNAHEKRLET